MPAWIPAAIEPPRIPVAENPAAPSARPVPHTSRPPPPTIVPAIVNGVQNFFSSLAWTNCPSLPSSGSPPPSPFS